MLASFVSLSLHKVQSRNNHCRHITNCSNGHFLRRSFLCLIAQNGSFKNAAVQGVMAENMNLLSLVFLTLLVALNAKASAPCSLPFESVKADSILQAKFAISAEVKRYDKEGIHNFQIRIPSSFDGGTYFRLYVLLEKEGRRIIQIPVKPFSSETDVQRHSLGIDNEWVSNVRLIAVYEITEKCENKAVPVKHIQYEFTKAITKL